MTRRSPTLSLSCSVTRIAVTSCESAGLVQVLVALENPTPRVTRDVALPTGQIDHLLPLELGPRALDHGPLRLHQLEEPKGVCRRHRSLQFCGLFALVVLATKQVVIAHELDDRATPESLAVALDLRPDHDTLTDVEFLAGDRLLADRQTLDQLTVVRALVELVGQRQLTSQTLGGEPLVTGAVADTEIEGGEAGNLAAGVSPVVQILDASAVNLTVHRDLGAAVEVLGHVLQDRADVVGVSDAPVQVLLDLSDLAGPDQGQVLLGEAPQEQLAVESGSLDVLGVLWGVRLGPDAGIAKQAESVGRDTLGADEQLSGGHVQLEDGAGAVDLLGHHDRLAGLEDLLVLLEVLDLDPLHQVGGGLLSAGHGDRHRSHVLLEPELLGDVLAGLVQLGHALPVDPAVSSLELPYQALADLAAQANGLDDVLVLAAESAGQAQLLQNHVGDDDALRDVRNQLTGLEAALLDHHLIAVFGTDVRQLQRVSVRVLLHENLVDTHMQLGHASPPSKGEGSPCCHTTTVAGRAFSVNLRSPLGPQPTSTSPALAMPVRLARGHRDSSPRCTCPEYGD